MSRLFRVYVPTSTLVLAVFETLVIIGSFLLSIYLLTETDFTDYLTDNLKLISLALITVSILAGMFFQGLYSQVRVIYRLLLAQQLLMSVGIAFLLQALLSVIAPDFYLPFTIMLLGSLLAVVIMLAGRLVLSAYVLPSVAMERLVLLGDSPLLDDIAAYLEQMPQSGIQVAGRIQVSDMIAGDAAGTHTKLETLIRSFASNRVVVGMERLLDAAGARELLELRFAEYSIEDASATLARISNREGVSGLNPMRLLYTREFEPSVRFFFFQSLSHILIAAVCILALLPLMLLIALCIRLTSPGPVVERQECVGLNGDSFGLWHFRIRAVDTGRLTGVGRLLARTGLYALPQFFNVLFGQISIIGPKPYRREFVRELAERIPFYPHRSKMRPGMTGWAQIQSRRRSGLPDSIAELEYDLYYLKCASVMMDVFILAHAIKNVLLWGGQP